MKKTYTLFAVPKMVALIAMLALSQSILIGAFCAMAMGWYALIIAALCFVVPHTVFAFKYHNAYTAVYMTEEGIGNGKLFFKWDEIESFRVLDACFYYVNGTPDINLKLCEMVCIGDVANDFFWMQEKEKCIYFPLTKKTKKMISLLCVNKNRAVADIIDFDRMKPCEK